MTNAVTASLKYLRMSPKKLRLLCDLIRGKKVDRAITTLAMLNKVGARPLKKLLESAVANAMHNHKLESETLVVKSITVDGGPVLKRFMPKAHGRATPVRERTSHINVMLMPIEAPAQGGSTLGGKVKATK